ncbi:phage tail tape measure protein [Vibrio aquimaris]|uniref:Chromosome segregation protein n=2 Tax=Vibrio aquimaris TaxID=2587862 RepID=A0A5P9CRD9_9VIBR|nr:chromosome segregation protein [Vibrio aquimaris]
MLKKVVVDYVANTMTAQADVENLTQSQSKLSNAMTSVKAKGKELNAQLSDVRAYESYEKRIATINDTLRQNQKRIEELTKKKQQAAESGNKTVKFLKSEAKELDRLTNKNKMLSVESKGLASSLDAVSEKLEKAGINTRDLGSEKDTLTRKSQRLTKQLKEEQDHLKRVADHQQRRDAALDKAKDAGKTASIAAVAAVGASYVNASTREYQFAEVAKTLEEGTTSQEEQALKQVLERIAMNTANMSTSDAFALAAGGSAGGIKNADLAAYVEQTGKIAAAWDMDAFQAADITMAIRNSMSLDSAGLNRLADEINQASNSFGTTADRVVKTIAQDGATMTENGFTNQQTVAMATALNTLGAAPEQAGTIMKNLVLNMAAGDKASNPAKEAFEQIGLDSVSVSERMAEGDAQGALNQVFEGIRSLDKAEQTGVIKEIFGSEGFSKVQALIAKEGWLGEIESTLIDKEGNNLASGAVNAEYATIANTSLKRDEMMTDSLLDLSQALGESFMPVMDEIRPIVIDAAQGTAEFIRENKNLVSGLMVVGGVVATVAAGMKVWRGVQSVKTLAGLANEARELKRAELARKGASRSASALARRIAVLDRAMKMAGHGRGGGLDLGRGSRKGKARGKIAGLTSALSSSKAAKVAGVARRVPMLGVGLSAVEAAGALSTGDTKGAVEAGGGAAGAAAGMAIGSVIGSVIPVAGTALGAAAGAYLGDMGGRWLAKMSYNFFSSPDSKSELTGEPLPNKQKEIAQAQQQMALAAQMPPVQVHVDATGATPETANLVANQTSESLKETIRQLLEEERRKETRRATYSLG